MRESETFGSEKGSGEELVQWLNDEAIKRKMKFEARLYDYVIKTENFGTFEMFSWMGDVKTARSLIVKASKADFAMVRKGDKIIGHLKFTAPRIGKGDWELVEEERR